MIHVNYIILYQYKNTHKSSRSDPWFQTDTEEDKYSDEYSGSEDESGGSYDYNYEYEKEQLESLKLSEFIPHPRHSGNEHF